MAQHNEPLVIAIGRRKSGKLKGTPSNRKQKLLTHSNTRKSIVNVGTEIAQIKRGVRYFLNGTRESGNEIDGSYYASYAVRIKRLQDIDAVATASRKILLLRQNNENEKNAPFLAVDFSPENTLHVATGGAHSVRKPAKWAKMIYRGIINIHKLIVFTVCDGPVLAHIKYYPFIAILNQWQHVSWCSNLHAPSAKLLCHL